MNRPDEVGTRPDPGKIEVFIYYRIAPGDEDALRRTVTAFQHALRRRFAGLDARLLRRAGGPVDGELLTMMESYSLDQRDPAAVVDDLLAAISDEAAAVESLIRGGRHVEAFEACV